MSRNIRIESLMQVPLEEQHIELVERKCLGHPDSLADGIAESISQALCKAYLDECGVVLHHNTDQGEIVAGESLPKFGGGKVIKPIYILLDGRATKRFDKFSIPTDAIALDTARIYLKSILPELNLDREVIIDSRLGEGSTDLRDVFKPCQASVPRANDTSFGVGYAPFTETETIVKSLAAYIDDTMRPKYPVIGQDLKIMAVRDGDDITLTIACAMVDKYCSSIKEYFEYKEMMQEQLISIAKKHTGRKVHISVNTADDPTQESVFLTVTGTSAEMGDDGSVGRGNRCNGLITPNRPMSMEATSGKNPINHIGKIYNILSNEIANGIVEEVNGIQECYVRLLSQIGQPIDYPLVASVQVLTEKGIKIEDISIDINEIVNKQLSEVTCITEKVIKGEIKTF